MSISVVVKGGHEHPTLKVLRGTYKGCWSPLVDGALPFTNNSDSPFVLSKLPKSLTEGGDLWYYQSSSDTGSLRLSICTTGTVFVFSWNDSETACDAMCIMPGATRSMIADVGNVVTLWEVGSRLAASGRAQAALNLIASGDVDKRCVCIVVCVWLCVACVCRW